MTSMPSSRLVTPSITTPQTQRELSFLGELYRVRVSGADTAGGFAVLDTEGRRGHGSPLHIHRNASETFLVLEGTLRVVVDGAQYDAGPGCAAVLPSGLPHGFVITSDTARYLTLHHGPGFEDFVAAVARDGGDTPDPDRLTAIAADHGIDIVGPLPVPRPPDRSSPTQQPLNQSAPHEGR
jgi:quercetin dioxygenase-like cupin family protein